MVEDVYASSFISIHTPLAGSDSPDSTAMAASCNFNPHSPCGERLEADMPEDTEADVFQSTLPLRGATHGDIQKIQHVLISIHTPLAGSDGQFALFSRISVFQSTLPLRGATWLRMISTRSS